jgi:O-antigen/teichoic acid export membrane protein
MPGQLKGLAGMSGWGVISWLALGTYSFVLTALVFRHFGPALFGLWAVIASMRSLLMLLDGGLALGVTRDVVLSRDEAVARQRVASAYRLYLGIGAAVLVFGLASASLPALLLHLSGSSVGLSRLVTMIVVVDVAVALASSPLYATLRGRGRFDILAAASIVQSAFGLLVAWLLINRLGLPGVAVATLASRVIAGGFVLGFLSTSGFRPWRSSASVPALRAVIGFAVPLYILTIASQIAIGSDVPIVGAFYGSIAAASYGLGAAIPASAAALLFTVLDVAFPSLSSTARGQSARLMQSMLIIGSALGALGFATIALNSAALLKVWVGTAPTLAVAVMVIYSGTWLLNVPSHVLTIGAIAQGHHHVLAPVVLSEALVNVSLSVLLAATYSPTGPAIATLVTLFVSNIIVLPLILRRRLQLSLRVAGSQVLLGGGYGLALSLIVWLVTSRQAGPLNQLIGAFIGTIVAAMLILVAGTKIRNASI